MPPATILGALLLFQPTPSSPSIETLIDKVAAIRAERTAHAAREAEAVRELRAAVAALRDKLDKLGLDDVVPPPPDPTDPFAAALKVAYAADAGPSKPEQLATLAELYKQAAALSDQTSVTTTGQLMERIRAASSVLKIDGLLPCRKLVAAECLRTLGDDPDKPMDAACRIECKALFVRIHLALLGAAK